MTRWCVIAIVVWQEWRHINSSVKTSYRGTVIKASIEEGMQVHFDVDAVRARSP